MDKRKSGTGSGAAFYATLAVCLLAMGVGTFQLLRRTELRGNAETPPQITAVSDLPKGTEEAAEALSPSAGRAGTESGGIGLSGGTAAPSTASSGSSGTSGTAGTSGISGTTGTTAGSEDGVKSRESGGENAGSRPSGSGSGTASRSGTGGGSRDGSKGEASRTVSAAVPLPEASAKGGAEDGGSGTGADGDRDAGEGERLAVLRPLEGEVVAAFSVDSLLFNETLGDWRTHDGVDVAAAEGTPVLAACDGTVAAVTEDALMGNTVVLSHDGGYLTTYASLMETADLEPGDHVTAGTPLGAVGSTAAAEAAQGPHLHFSVRRDGEAVDPDEFLQGDLAVTAANVEPMEASD